MPEVHGTFEIRPLGRLVCHGHLALGMELEWNWVEALAVGALSLRQRHALPLLGAVSTHRPGSVDLMAVCRPPLAKTDEALNEGVRRARLSRADRVSTWWISVMMVVVFLILLLFLIQVLVSKPKSRYPTESAWYCYDLPLVNILSGDHPGSVLPPPCDT